MCRVLAMAFFCPGSSVKIKKEVGMFVNNYLDLSQSYFLLRLFLMIPLLWLVYNHNYIDRNSQNLVVHAPSTLHDGSLT